MWNMFKVNDKNTRTILVFLYCVLIYFEQVSVKCMVTFDFTIFKQLQKFFNCLFL